MKINEERLQDLPSYLGNLSHAKANEIPNIDLYVDQAITLMDSHLGDMGRHPGDKVLTKTMINNCAKNNLLSPLAKKKHSKDYTLMLVFIYYFKDLPSFNDIEELFRSITSKHFSGQTSQLSLEGIYSGVFTLKKDETNNLKSGVVAKFIRAQGIFSDTPVDDKDKEYLRLFAFIYKLSFNMYLKIQTIEMIADQLREDAPAPRKKQVP